MKNASPLVRLSVRNGVIGGLLGMLMLIGLYYIRPTHPLILLNPFLDIRIFLFPIFILLGLAARKHSTLSVLFIVWSLLFMGAFVSQFVRGMWAF